MSDDDFLLEWRAEAERSYEELKIDTATASADERADLATQAGFRTWHDYSDWSKAMLHALRLFTSDPTFAAIWNDLRKSDRKEDRMALPLFGPQNGGAPMQILYALQFWYQAPKFTAAELSRHRQRIAAKCDELIGLLGQMTPGGLFDDFKDFDLTAPEADGLFDAFGTVERKRKTSRSGLYSQWAATERLKQAGIDPLWSIGKIKTFATRPARAFLPRKVRAPTAYRTYMILSVSQAIAGLGPRRPLAVSDQRIADAVALLIDSDCSIDDARKVIADWRSEDSA